MQKSEKIICVISGIIAVFGLVIMNILFSDIMQNVKNGVNVQTSSYLAFAGCVLGFVVCAVVMGVFLSKKINNIK